MRAQVQILGVSDPHAARARILRERETIIAAANVKDKVLEAVKGTKVNEAKFNECYDGKKTLDLVKADMADGSGVGVTGTPAFLINGRKIVGAQPFESFKAVIDEELARK